MIKTFSELRTYLHEARASELDRLIEKDEDLYENFYRTQGYIMAIEDVDMLLRNSIKYQDDVE